MRFGCGGWVGGNGPERRGWLAFLTAHLDRQGSVVEHGTLWREFVPKRLHVRALLLLVPFCFRSHVHVRTPGRTDVPAMRTRASLSVPPCVLSYLVYGYHMPLRSVRLHASCLLLNPCVLYGCVRAHTLSPCSQTLHLSQKPAMRFAVAPPSNTPAPRRSCRY